MFILYHLHPLSISSFIIFIIYYPHPLSISSFIIFILYHPHPLSSSSVIIFILYQSNPLSCLSFIILIIYQSHPLSSFPFNILILYHPHPLSYSSFIILILYHPHRPDQIYNPPHAHPPHHHQYQARCAGRAGRGGNRTRDLFPRCFLENKIVQSGENKTSEFCSAKWIQHKIPFQRFSWKFRGSRAKTS